jgi:SNF2 family DNA or RNA helicase
MKPTLKTPGTKRLKLTCNKLLSNAAFKFELRHCNKVLIFSQFTMMLDMLEEFCNARGHAYLVGRCRLTLSNPS